MDGFELAQFVGWYLGYLVTGYCLVAVAGIFWLKSASPSIKAGILTGPAFAFLLLQNRNEFDALHLSAMALGGLTIFVLYRWRLIRKRETESVK